MTQKIRQRKEPLPKIPSRASARLLTLISFFQKTLGLSHFHCTHKIQSGSGPLKIAKLRRCIPRPLAPRGKPPPGKPRTSRVKIRTYQVAKLPRPKELRAVDVGYVSNVQVLPLFHKSIKLEMLEMSWIFLLRLGYSGFQYCSHFSLRNPASWCGRKLEQPLKKKLQIKASNKAADSPNHV